MAEGAAVEHRWGFSILPVETGEQDLATALVGIALCNRCFLSVTNRLPYTFDEGKSTLHYIPSIPKFGCVDPFAGVA